MMHVKRLEHPELTNARQVSAPIPIPLSHSCCSSVATCPKASINVLVAKSSFSFTLNLFSASVLLIRQSTMKHLSFQPFSNTLEPNTYYSPYRVIACIISNPCILKLPASATRKIRSTTNNYAILCQASAKFWAKGTQGQRGRDSCHVVREADRFPTV